MDILRYSLPYRVSSVVASLYNNLVFANSDVLRTRECHGIVSAINRNGNQRNKQTSIGLESSPSPADRQQINEAYILGSQGFIRLPLGEKRQGP